MSTAQDRDLTVRELPVRCVSTRRDGVGESAVWSAGEACLYRVDITGHAICRLDPTTGHEDEWAMPEIVTSIGLATNGLVVGLRKRVCLYEPGGDLRELAVVEPELPKNRLNEGAVAPDGTFWVGTMRDNIGPDGEDIGIDAWTGALHSVANDGSVRQLTSNETGICNTMVWTNGRFVTADTLADRLYSFETADDGRSLGARTELAGSGPPGAPDGSALDAEGYVWNARFGGGCLARFAPNGSLDCIVPLPCRNPTSCAFGGPDHNTLFVTSARFGLSEDALQSRPEEGGVFAVDTSVTGYTTRQFKVN